MNSERRNLSVGGVQRCSRLEVDLDDGFAVQGRGLDVLNVVDECRQGLFIGRGEATLELFRTEAGVLPGDGDDREC